MSNALPVHHDLEELKGLARDLVEACDSSDPGAFHRWAVRLRGGHDGREYLPEKIERRWIEFRKTAEDCSLETAESFIAREHGFASWPEFSSFVQDMTRDGSDVYVFEAAADAIVEGNIEALRKLIDEHPGLTRQRSTRFHHSTLLHYVSANGVEDFRQITPPNIVEITSLLLDAGSEIDAESDDYGGGCTTLGLVATSVHPEHAGVQIELMETLLERGAKMDLPSAGGNRHSLIYACFANGQPKAGEYLASRGAPVDLAAAGALGRVDIIRGYFDEYGNLRPPTTSKQMQNSFVDACWNGRVDVVKFLLDRGGSVDLKSEIWDATALEATLWSWQHPASADVRERCCEVVALLARAGAKLDAGTLSGPLATDSRMQAALRGEMPQ